MLNTLRGIYMHTHAHIMISLGWTDGGDVHFLLSLVESSMLVMIGEHAYTHTYIHTYVHAIRGWL